MYWAGRDGWSTREPAFRPRIPAGPRHARGIYPGGDGTCQPNDNRRPRPDRPFLRPLGAARLELLKEEKELTRRSDELARRRQELPWVRIDKPYRFETDEGNATLADLFRGRSQLLVYHFMFGPDYTAGCATCSTIADGFDGFAVHLANHDVMLSAVSRAPLAKLRGYKRRMGWTFPWASAVGGEFNFDFGASFTEQQQREGIEYNYQREPAWQQSNGGISDS